MPDDIVKLVVTAESEQEFFLSVIIKDPSNPKELAGQMVAETSPAFHWTCASGQLSASLVP